MHSNRTSIVKLAIAVSALVFALVAVPAAASADAVSDLYGAEYDRIAVLEAGDGAFEPEAPASDDASADGEGVGIMLLDTGRVAKTLTPREVSPEMLYFCKWESGQNYDQGLSWGDGYHAMGYFQFDNRYDLGSFLYSVYCYNPTKYSALKVIGDKYGWNVNRDTRKDGDFTEFGNDLNAAWHACYKADPTEFSNLQNDWAYTQYYDSSDGIRGSLLELGINIDDRSDCVKSLVWGMANLFGKGGGKYEIRNGNYWGAIWFIKNSGINGSMDDETLVTTLCDYVINNVARRYPSQPQYHQGWQNRYRGEKAHYLTVIEEAAASDRESLDALATANRDAITDGTYVIRALCSSRAVLDVARASTANGANVRIWEADNSDSQRWTVSHDSAGYITFTNVKSGKVLEAAGSTAGEGVNVQQWQGSGAWNQKWIAVPDSRGGVTLVSALRSNRALDVCGGVSASGTNVQIWTTNGGAAQSFEFMDAHLGVFSDIFVDTPHANDVAWLYENSISTGFDNGDGTFAFRPYASVARCDMAAFLYRIAGSPAYEAPSKSPFRDVTPGTPHYREICWLAESGVSRGYGDGTFRPYSMVVRQDMAAFLRRLSAWAGNDVSGVGPSPFSDVRDGDEANHADDVCWLAANGVSTGFPDGTFGGMRDVARCDMAAFLRRMSDKGLV